MRRLTVSKRRVPEAGDSAGTEAGDSAGTGTNAMLCNENDQIEKETLHSFREAA